LCPPSGPPSSAFVGVEVPVVFPFSHVPCYNTGSEESGRLGTENLGAATPAGPTLRPTPYCGRSFARQRGAGGPGLPIGCTMDRLLYRPLGTSQRASDAASQRRRASPCKRRQDLLPLRGFLSPPSRAGLAHFATPVAPATYGSTARGRGSRRIPGTRRPSSATNAAVRTTTRPRASGARTHILGRKGYSR
jgi:hypothetical protein